MFKRIEEFLSRNGPPIGVVTVVAFGLLLAAFIQPRYTSDASAARILAARLQAPSWRPLPAPETVLRRIAFASCLQQWRPAPILASLTTTRPDLLLMMGDNVYGDVKSPDMRELYNAYVTLAAHGDFSPVVASTPILAVWDDHDYGLNDADGTFAHRAQSTQFFQKFWQGSGTTPSARPDGIYYARYFGPPGQRIQIIMLDTRSHRSPFLQRTVKIPGFGRYQPDDSPQKTLLGEQQWAWLEQELRKPADVRLIVSSIQVLAEGHNFERWGNLPRERKRLMDLLTTTRADGVVLLSGDRHRAAIYRDRQAIGYPLFEATSSSLNRPTLVANEHGPNQLHPMYLDVNFGLLDIDWQARTLTMTIRGESGDVVRNQSIAFSELQPRQ